MFFHQENKETGFEYKLRNKFKTCFATVKKNNKQK